MTRHSWKRRLITSVLLFPGCAMNNPCTANSTLAVPFPRTNYDSQDSSRIEQFSGYGNGGDYYDLPKKPSPGQGSFRGLQNTLWLVPVLRYLITVNGDSVQIEANPVVSLLPVVLQTAASWWFHEPQLLNLMHERNETVVATSVLLTSAPVDGNSGEASKTTLSSNTTNGHQGSSRKAESKAVSLCSSSKTHKKGEKNEDEVIHLCRSKKCPACNYSPCHCVKCSAVLEPITLDQMIESDPMQASKNNKRRRDVPEGSPPEKKLKTTAHYGTTSVVKIATPKEATPKGAAPKGAAPLPVLTNIVSLLRQREVTGNLYNKPILLQAALETRGPVTPELEFVAHSSSWGGGIRTETVITLENRGLLSWVRDDIKIWSLQADTYISDKVPVEHYGIERAFAFSMDHIIVWFEEGLLQEWRIIAGSWQSNDMASDISNAIQLNQRLVTFSKKNISLRVWTKDEQWFVFTEIQGFYWPQQRARPNSMKLFAVSETQFVTANKIYREGSLLHIWSEESGIWTSNDYYETKKEAKFELYILNDQTQLLIKQESGTYPFAWKEASLKWNQLPLDISFLTLNNGGVLPDGRLCTTMLSGRYQRLYNLPIYSLLLLSEAEKMWKTSVVFRCPEEKICYYDAVVLLEDGRLAVALSIFSFYTDHYGKRQAPAADERTIRVFLERQGKWESVILGHIDDPVSGMTTLDEEKLVTWHNNGSIKIWKLYP